MKDLIDWVAAVLVISIILLFMYIGALIIGSAILVVFVVAVMYDIINIPLGWLSSLFPSTKEKGKREEESGDG